jgi:hypothetical protein
MCGSALKNRPVAGSYKRPFMWIKPTSPRSSCPVKACRTLLVTKALEGLKNNNLDARKQ